MVDDGKEASRNGSDDLESVKLEDADDILVPTLTVAAIWVLVGKLGR